MKDKEEILCFRRDSGAPGPHVLISTGVNGDEYEPMLAARELIGLLAGILIPGRTTIVSMVNASAYGRRNGIRKRSCGDQRTNIESGLLHRYAYRGKGL